MSTLTVKDLLSRKINDRRFMENVRAVKQLPASEGHFADFPDWIHPQLRSVLVKRGMGQLYSHQAEAVRFVRKNRNVVFVTPTESGNTLCYNLPVFNRILEEPET